MSPRRRLVALLAVCAVVVVAAAGYVVHTRVALDAQAAAAPRAALTDLSSVETVPHLVFRSTLLGSGYGQVAMTPLGDPDGPRALTGHACDRVAASAGRYLCLAADRGVVTTFSAKVLDAHLDPLQDLPLSGVASRARLSRDGTLAATTTFVSGHSYAATSFVTQTLVSRVGGSPYGNLEDFTLVHRGRVVRPSDRNLWGVTFADDDSFYVTVAWGGRTWLAHGSLSQHRIETIREDAECPSLSPDRTRVAYKKRLGLPRGRWRLAVYDLATGRETLLAETRTVDDQVEWLDDRTVVYGLPRTGADAAVSDVWRVPADGTGAASVLVHGAWSPTVVDQP